MTPDVNYFIHVKDHINKSARVINKMTNLNTYSQDFNTIVKYLNKDNMFNVSMNNSEAELFKLETQVVPGYIYNSTKTVNTLVYTLSLIKIDSQLSNIFQVTYTTAETQTIEQDNTENIQTQTQTQEQEQSKDTKASQTNEEYDNSSSNEFGEFQGYVPPEFTDVDLNPHPYCNNVITPPYPNYQYNSYPYGNTYNPYNPFTSNPYNQYTSYESNPFNTVMNLRGEGEDVHYTFGSQVPQNPTTPLLSSSNTWSPELISELKCRLSQPNAGLTHRNNTYFL